MSFLQTFTRAQLRQMASNGYNAGAKVPAATDPISGLGAFFDGNTLPMLELQRMAVYVAQISRLSTIPLLQSGLPNPDLDSFGAQFNIPRGGQTYSSGQVLFETLSPIPVGYIAQANGLNFAAVADGTNAAYNAALSEFVPTNGVVSVTVQCTTPGIVGNVQAGQITTLYGGPGVPSVTGITSCSNPLAFTNGAEFEADPAYKVRIRLRLSTGVVATSNATAAAILSVQPGLTYSVCDRQNADGSTHSAYFTVFVAPFGASGPTPASLITAVETALEGDPPNNVPAVRTLGISYQVLSPTILAMNVSALITMVPGNVQSVVEAACVSAVQELIEDIGLDPAGNPTLLPFGQIFATLYAVPGVKRVDQLVVNGASPAAAVADPSAGIGVLMAPGNIVLTIA